MIWPGWGIFPGNNWTIVSEGSRFRTAVGPQKPWLSELCGSRSAKSTRSPNLENAPARWKVQLLLPHPPFWFRRVIVLMVAPSLDFGSHPKYRPDYSPGIRTTKVSRPDLLREQQVGSVS